jgi:hypothetical protein
MNVDNLFRNIKANGGDGRHGALPLSSGKGHFSGNCHSAEGRGRPFHT